MGTVINHNKEATKGAPAKGDAKPSLGAAKEPSPRAIKADEKKLANMVKGTASIDVARVRFADADGTAEMTGLAYATALNLSFGDRWWHVPEKGTVDDNCKAVQQRRIEEHKAFTAYRYTKGKSKQSTSNAWTRICRDYAPRAAGETKGSNEKLHWRAKTIVELGRDYLRINNATDAKPNDLKAAALCFEAYGLLGGDLAELNKKNTNG